MSENNAKTMTKINTDESKIKVTISIPETTNEAVRRQKINRIYDVLKPKETA